MKFYMHKNITRKSTTQHSKEFSWCLTPHVMQSRSFQRQYSQPVT